MQTEITLLLIATHWIGKSVGNAHQNLRKLEAKKPATEKGVVMSNPRKFRQPVRLIVSIEAQTVSVIDTFLNADSYHRNRSEFVRQAIEREIRRCQSDDLCTPLREGI